MRWSTPGSPLDDAHGPSGLMGRVALLVFGLALSFDNINIPGIGGAANIGVAVLAVAAAWQIISTNRLRRPSPTLLLLAGFTAWCGLSLLWAYDLSNAATRFLTMLSLLALVWISWQVAITRRDLRWLMVGYLVGCGVAVALAWRAFLSGTIYIGHADATESAAEWVDVRYASLSFDPNEMGISLALTIPIVVHLALSMKSRARYLAAVYIAFVLSGIALSGSRGAALTASVALFLSLVWLARRSVSAMALALGCTIVVVGAAWVVTPQSWERILTVRQQLAGGSMGLRVPIWRAGLRLFLSHPVTGVGVGEFAGAVQRYLGYEMVAHNTPLSVATELGIVGVLLFFGAFVANVASALRGRNVDRELVIGTVLTWGVGVLSLTYEHRKQTWFVLLLTAAVGQLWRVEREAKAAREPTPPPGTAVRVARVPVRGGAA